MKHKSACKWQVAPSCGQICNHSKRGQVMVKQTLSFVHWNEVQIWWKEILEIRKCWFEWNTNLFSRNSANLKRRNIWTAQSKFNAHREQTLLTCFLILVSSWRGWTCSCTPMTPRSGTSSTLLSQNDFIHHQADIQNGEDWLPLLQWQEGCKENWQQCGEEKGCIIDVHVDFNNLPSLTKQPLVVVHHIVIVLQCLIISWEKLIIDKIIQPKSNESMWYFRPLELLEGFFSSVFKLVVLEFISWKASLLNDEHVCRETTSSWARVVALLAAERLFSQMG